MPNRVLWEKRITSRNFNQLSGSAEVLFTRILSKVDDFGRVEADPEVLKGSCFPLKPNIKPKAIAKSLAELVNCQMIHIYMANGRLFLVFRRWDENNPHYCVTKEGKPTRHRAKCPEPPEDLNGIEPVAMQYLEGFFPGFANLCQPLPKLLYPYPYPEPEKKKGTTTKGETESAYIEKVNAWFQALLSDQFMDELKKAYPKKSVKEELEKARMWLVANPEKRKKSFKRFVNNWMAREFKPFLAPRIQARLDQVSKDDLDKRVKTLLQTCKWMAEKAGEDTIIEAVGKYGISMVDRALKHMESMNKPGLGDFWKYVRQ